MMKSEKRNQNDRPIELIIAGPGGSPKVGALALAGPDSNAGDPISTRSDT
jgi:hypothetical protein